MMDQQIPALIPLTYIAFAALIPLVGMWNKNSGFWMALTGAGLATLFSAVGFFEFMNEETLRYFFGGWEPPVGIEFVYDGLSSFFVLVINAIALLVIYHSYSVGRLEFLQKRMPYYTLVMLALLGFNGMILTGDLFNLYVFLEISSLASYGLIAIGEKRAPYASYRYLLIGTVGASFYLLGIGFMYTITGTLNIIDMAEMIPSVIDNTVAISGLLLMVLGMGIKAALFPIHGWLPDAYTYASSTSSAFIAPIGTKVAAYVMIRVVLYLFGIPVIEDQLWPITVILGALAAAGILYGSIMAIAQTELKRMLAYSSISQIGYIIMGFSLANPMGYVGALLHVLNHAVMKACLFLVSANLRSQEGHTDISLFDHSYRKKYPSTMLWFTVAAMSMIGLPPLAGFFSKWYLALGTIENNNWIFLAVILASSLLNAVYFFRILERVYMRNPEEAKGEEKQTAKNEPGSSMLLPTAMLGLALFVIGFANAYIVSVLMQFFPN